MLERIEQAFPRLRGAPYQVTSPEDDRYNCIAWAAGDPKHWWWPDEPDQPVYRPGSARPCRFLVASELSRVA